MADKKLAEFLSIWNKKCHDNLSVKVHNENFVRWRTPHIDVRETTDNGNVDFSPRDKNERKNRNEKAHRLGFNELSYNNLLPEDLYVLNADSQDSIAELFRIAYFYYAMAFICDFCSKNDENFYYRLNGFKTKEYKFANLSLKELHIDKDSLNNLNDIYNWIYTGGNTFDKMAIARNILSINLPNTDTVDISSNIFTSIQSNFRFYTKENAKSFISLRNEISKILLDQENKIASYVSAFSSDFKKSILPSVTFFISVIAIRAISNQSLFDGFSPTVMTISVFLVILSAIHLAYSLLGDLNQKLDFAQRQMQDIKKRYSCLLTDEELKDIFNENNENEKLNCFAFAKKQRTINVAMWILCLASLVICLCFIGVKHENIENTNKPLISTTNNKVTSTKEKSKTQDSLVLKDDNNEKGIDLHVKPKRSR